LSCYEVIYEADTPLYQQLQAGRFDVDEDLACAMYETLLEDASRHGFHQYEIANFARHRGAGPDALPSLACLHNVNAWRGGAYHGLGPSACSFVPPVRSRNVANTRLYCEQLEQGRSALESRDFLAPIQRAGEIAAFGLRMNIGWAFEEFTKVTGLDLRTHWHNSMTELVARGWGAQSATGFHLTPAGLRFADAAAILFLT